jgi:predicted RNase H-like HicB family nuclease
VTELIFEARESLEGGYWARAIGEDVFTDAQTIPELRANIRDAIRCHFDTGMEPKIIRMILVHEETFTA